jgi:hypothetical protein
MAQNQKTWTMSPLQKSFLDLVANAGDNGITYREAKRVIPTLSTGAINTLITKGYVSTDGATRDFVAQIVYDGEVIGKKTYNDKVYRLVQKD